MKLYKYNPRVVDMIDFADFVEAIGLPEDQVYNYFMENSEHMIDEIDGDFIFVLDLDLDEMWMKIFREKLSEEVRNRNQLGVQFCQ